MKVVPPHAVDRGGAITPTGAHFLAAGGPGPPAARGEETRSRRSGRSEVISPAPMQGRAAPLKKKVYLVVEQLCREDGMCFPDDTGILTDQLDGVGLADKARIRHVHSGILIPSKVSKCIDESLVKFLCIVVDA